MQTFVSNEKLSVTKITVAGEDGKKILFVYGLSDEQVVNAITLAFGQSGEALGNGHTQKLRRTRRTKAQIEADAEVAA